MIKTKHVLIGILGVILMPVLVSLYILDRIICLPLLHLNMVNIQTWYRNSNEVGYSIIRLIMTCIIVLFISLIYWWI